MSQTKRRQGKRASTREEGEGKGDVEDAMAATSCRSRRPRYAQNINNNNNECQSQNAANRFMSMPCRIPHPSLLDAAHPRIEPGTFALMLAHLHLTENTFNKRDLRNSCSSVKVRLGLLFASCSCCRNVSAFRIPCTGFRWVGLST